MARDQLTEHAQHVKANRILLDTLASLVEAGALNHVDDDPKRPWCHPFLRRVYIEVGIIWIRENDAVKGFNGA